MRGQGWQSLTPTLAMLVVGLNLYGATLEVCPTCSIQTIQEGVRRAQPYDTVWVRPSRYTEWDVTVDKPLTIIADSGAILDVQFRGQGLIIHNVDSVTVIGLAIRNIAFSSLEELSAVTVLNARYFRLLNLRIDSVFFGILVEHSVHGEIAHCVIRSSTSGHDEATMGNGIHLWKSDSIHIHHNYIEGMRDGIYFEFVTASLIEHNTSVGNLRYGLHFMFSNNDVYQYNWFERNGAGVAVMFSRNIQMLHNTFIHNWGMSAYGLLLKEIYDGVIQHNRFIRNTTAIRIEGSTRIRYEYNVFIDNGWAVSFVGGAYDNFFFRNDFSGNSFDVAYFGRPNNNRFMENYWSKHSGYDLNRDSFSDVPYRPVGLFTYLTTQVPETVVLLYSFLIRLLDLAERLFPVLTPVEIQDTRPRLYPWHSLSSEV